MKCIDEEFEIKGNYDTDSASNLLIVFEKCDSSQRKCKTDTEIEQFLKWKYILYSQNEI